MKRSRNIVFTSSFFSFARSHSSSLLETQWDRCRLDGNIARFSFSVPCRPCGKVYHSPLRFFSSTPPLHEAHHSDSSVSPPLSSGSETTSTPNEDDEEEEVISPVESQPLEEKARYQEQRQKTQEFLRLVLYTRDEQLWKDLLCSALRCHGTLQTRHVEEWLRMVTRPIPTTSMANRTSSMIPEESSAPMKLPYERLLRVVEIVQFIHEVQEEMKWEKEQAHPHPNEEMEAAKGVVVPTVEKERIASHASSPPPSGEKGEVEFEKFLCTSRVLVQLLVLMIRGAAHTLDCLRANMSQRQGSLWNTMNRCSQGNDKEEGTIVDIQFSSPSSEASAPSTPPIKEAGQRVMEQKKRSSTTSSSPSEEALFFSYTTLWRFLSWMERHRLPILSEKLIDTLETAVELDVEEEKLKALLSSSIDANTAIGVLHSSMAVAGKGGNRPGSPSPPPSHQVLHARREARLAYLQSERGCAASSASSASSFLQPSSSAFPPARQAPNI